MGAIGEQELMKWEKMQGEMNGGEEKVVVLVRLRPLNEKEIARDEVSDWECINETTILYRNSLQERSGFPTAYTYDRVFRGDCPTRLVYEEGTKEIAMSVVGGINSTIFAYGQTSSGKTYTMNGITDYAVADIYEYVQKHEERAFVLKFSAIEIYNEVVRDLLAPDNTQLRLLDDPEKGVIVEKLTEETLRDQSHLKELLSICEAQRQIGETSLNDASSRSHQILKLTIESSSREFLGKDKSTTLAASVNFVDLAGSERASQALSVGQRLKEGSHINRSLLTLGTVIRKLSNGRQGHVNYRDSKLTRILQPSLGGNARTTIICTVSPARSHVEQSRNTLLFASCAKEVTTNAQVNVVMSDKALVKHLQKELSRLESEIRTPAAPNCDHLPLLRKKDQQIGKLENDVRELTKQLELAHSRMEDLLQANESNQTSRQWGGLNPNRKWQEHNKWEDECSVSESSFETNPSYSDIAVQKPNTNWPSSSLSSKNKFALSTLFHSKKKHLHETRDNSDEMCKEVRCIETYDSNNDRIPESVVSSPNTPTDRNLNFMKKHNFNANLMSESSMPEFQTVEQSEKTPPSGYENSFRRKHWKFPQVNYGGNDPWLSESDSQSSVGSELLDELREHKNRNTGDEDIPSIDSFVAGLKEMAQLQYEKQLLDDKVQEMEKLAAKSLITMNDTTELDPMQEYPYHYSPGTTASDWPLRFQRLQASILELWQACNVSLVHRTYFFLLFKGDPTDSIYMEVELRRLSFLKETLSKRHPLTSDPSKKALRREFELLSRLMYKRFTEEERNRIYRKWGINLDSKRRRLELIRRLWSDTKDMNRIKDSASIIAKLIKFSEKNQAPKELFGLSFKPLRLSRRSFGWNKHGMSSSLI